MPTRRNGGQEIHDRERVALIRATMALAEDGASRRRSPSAGGALR